MDLRKNGSLLRDLRKARGMTQKDVADRVGVVPKTVSKWETGKANPDFEKQRFLADFFGVSVDYLLGRTDKKEEHTENDVPKENTIVYCRDGQTTQVELSGDKMNLILKMIDAIKDDDVNL